MRSESPACLDLAVAMLKPHHDRPTINVVQYLVGTAHLHLGNFADSIRHLETALSLYDEDLCRPVGFVTGHHLRSFTLIWLGLGQLYAGSPRKAAQTMSAAVQDARSRAHPFTLVSALLAVARFRNHVNDLEGAIDATEEGLAIATEQRSPYHVSRANILRAMNMVAASRVEEGIALMQHALAAHRATGANFLSSYNMSSLAEAHARAGDFERAVELADEAVAEVGRSGERWWEAEALRLRAEIQLRAHPKDHKEAERQFRSALACARRQAARLWEFQCAQSLAKLCLAQGRSHEARELLAPFGWAAAEGFDLVDPTLAAAIRAAPRSSAKPADRSRRRPRA
jgi:tetratricopeptide (TPR) repeat protein